MSCKDNDSFVEIAKMRGEQREANRSHFDSALRNRDSCACCRDKLIA